MTGDIWKWTAMQFHFSQLISINGFNDLKDKVETILINEMMLFLISQITMSISVEAKIVLIHDSSCLLIVFTEPSQFSCELHLKTKSNWVHGSKQYSYWLIKNAETHSVLRQAKTF